MVVAKSPNRVDSKMYNAALSYYGLPREYNRAFKSIVLYDKETKAPRLDKNGDPVTGLVPCNAILESGKGSAVWIQVNIPRKDTAFDERGRPKKASNDDIEIIHNVPLDFEYPQEPSLAHQIGLDLGFYLEEQGMAAEGLPVEDSGAGCHIILPIEPIKATPETAKLWNDAVRAAVKKYIEPEFERLAELYGISITLEGYDISRIFSVPGTWRPRNPRKPDCDALKEGYLRRWLPPYNEPGNYPTRRENQRLAGLIHEAFEALQVPAQPIHNIPKPIPIRPSNGRASPSQWLMGYARDHVNDNRSTSFHGLVSGLWKYYGDTTLIWSLKHEINRLSGEKYEEWRVDAELKRSIDKVALTPRDEDFVEYKPSKHAATSESNGNGNHNGSNTPPQIVTSLSRSFNLTDLGNAERFSLAYKDKVRWCETWNTWLVFNGKAWEHDRTGRADQLAKKTVRNIYHEAANEPDDEQRKRIIKHAQASESNRAVRALLDRAKSELPTTPELFNTRLHLLNCANGTLDLRTGTLQPHSANDMLTRCLKIKYNPQASCPKWLAFIDAVFAGDADLIRFMQQSLGMSLSGDTSEQCLFICHGSGSNGKTTLLETIRLIMGSYGFAANIETFQVHKNEGIRNDIAELYGARLVTASENTMGSRLNEAFVKKATGKEPLRARRLHENEFEFMPEFTLWLAVNHKPVVKDTSNGMWRRVHFIPFTVTFSGSAINKHLGEELLEEAEGILTWLVAGCMEWYRAGRLSPPQVVQDATLAYRQEMDVIARFLTERCIEKPQLEVGASALYAAYKAWCEETGERYEKQKTFGDSLSERGYTREKRRTGMVYIGLYIPSVNDVNDVNDSSILSREGKIQGEKPQTIMHNHSHHSHESVNGRNEADSPYLFSVNDHAHDVNDVNDRVRAPHDPLQPTNPPVKGMDNESERRIRRGRILSANPREPGESKDTYKTRIDALLKDV